MASIPGLSPELSRYSGGHKAIWRSLRAEHSALRPIGCQPGGWGVSGRKTPLEKLERPRVADPPLCDNAGFELASVSETADRFLKIVAAEALEAIRTTPTTRDSSGKLDCVKNHGKNHSARPPSHSPAEPGRSLRTATKSPTGRNAIGNANRLAIMISEALAKPISRSAQFPVAQFLAAQFPVAQFPAAQFPVLSGSNHPRRSASAQSARRSVLGSKLAAIFSKCRGFGSDLAITVSTPRHDGWAGSPSPIVDSPCRPKKPTVPRRASVRSNHGF